MFFDEEDPYEAECRAGREWEDQLEKMTRADEIYDRLRNEDRQKEYFNPGSALAYED